MTLATARHGFIAALTAYALWGVFPAFFKLFAGVDPVRILAHRALWSAVLGAVLIAWLLRGPWRAWRQDARRGRKLAVLGVTAALLASNWGVYIYAVTSGQVLEGSLGYFICPLVTVALGMIFLRERVGGLQLAALLLAGLGVAQLAVQAPSIPWLGLYLAGSFSAYGLLRKRLAMDPLLASSLESLWMAPVAAVYLLATHDSAPATDAATDALFVVSGVVTAVPLMLFALAAKRLAFTTMGLLQYVTPTLQFTLAVAAYGEPMSFPHALAFALIWTALGVTSFGALRGALRARRLPSLALRLPIAVEPVER